MHLFQTKIAVFRPPKNRIRTFVKNKNMLHEVEAKWEGKMKFGVETPGGTVTLDAAAEFGGSSEGLRSKPLMLTSLAGCTGIDIASLIEKMRIEVAGVQIHVSADLTDEHPKIYKKTHIVYTFIGQNLDEAKLEKAVNLSFDRYCGVIAMFKTFSEVTFEIVYSK